MFYSTCLRILKRIGGFAPYKTNPKRHDEASRKRYLHFATGHSMCEAVAGLAKAIAFSGYKPAVIQTDNGSELSDRALTRDGRQAANRDGPTVLALFCARDGIERKLIKPRIPGHNGKVERSCRIDQEKFYRTLRFHPLQDLAAQGSRWLRRCSETP